MNKLELIQELIDIELEMEKLWGYHPLNPNKGDVVCEYDVLNKCKSEIISNIDGFD
jgi:hypothetical protein